MVHLVLYSPKANLSSKYFPYHGYLGLTPLRVEGIVRTRLDEDGKLLPAKSLTVAVRCYELRLGRLTVLSSHLLVDHALDLWRKPDDHDYASIGDAEFPFRITLPPTVGGPSTVHFTDYRVFWKVEAVLNHIPIAGIGARQVKFVELPLIRYDVPPPLVSSRSLPPLLTPTLSSPPSPSSPSPSTSHPLLDSHQAPPSKLKTGPIRYAIEAPRNAIGPLDLASVAVWVGVDEGVTVKSVDVAIERRVEVREIESTAPFGVPGSQTKSAASPDGLGPRPPTPSTASASSSTTSLTPTSASITNTAYPASYSSSASAATMDTVTPLLSPPNAYAPSTTGTSSSGSDSTITINTAILRQPASPGLLPSPASPISPSPTSPSPHRGSVSTVHRPSLSSISDVNGVKSHVHTSQITSATSTHLTRLPEPGLSIFSKTVTFQWPAPKSNSRWALGESMRGFAGQVRFFVKVRATIQSAHGTDTVDLQMQPEVLVVSTNEAQRHLALSKYTESQVKPKSKSKSPRRHQRDERDKDAEEMGGVAIPRGKDGKGRAAGIGRSESASATVSGSGSASRSYSSSSGGEGTSPSSGRDTGRWKSSSVSSSATSATSSMHHAAPPLPAPPPPKPSPIGKRKTSRRPHTSAGPRDRSQGSADFAAGGVGIIGSRGAFYTPGLPDRDTFHTRSVGAASLESEGARADRERERKEREWEEELARIENRSRRSSADMLGFGRNAKRAILNAVGIGRA